MFDYSEFIAIITAAVYSVLWWLLAVAIVTTIIKIIWPKGAAGEARVKFATKFRLPADIYHPLHDTTLPTPDGTTQIDHIFVSKYGIFVVETKNMRGWIFGSEKKGHWTQTFYKKSFKFQNPLRQNYKHIKALENLLNISADNIHSVVAFVGDASFKTHMPANVTSGDGYLRYIKSFQKTVFDESEVQNIISTIESNRLAPGFKTNRQHIQNLQSRNNTSAERQCPKCGDAMILRTVKRGRNAGGQFWGCSSYPRCRIVQAINP